MLYKSMEYCPAKRLLSNRTLPVVSVPTLLKLLDTVQQRTSMVAGREMKEWKRAPHIRCAHGGCCSHAR